MKKSVWSRINYLWQNFIEDMFGMGNFSCPSYQNERKKVEKGEASLSPGGEIAEDAHLLISLIAPL